tara:strand:+ start:363 stop:575 length:213 start_codon:yes stop_codon:yes gene_type:complete
MHKNPVRIENVNCTTKNEIIEAKIKKYQQKKVDFTISASSRLKIIQRSKKINFIRQRLSQRREQRNDYQE